MKNVKLLACLGHHVFSASPSFWFPLTLPIYPSLHDYYNLIIWTSIFPLITSFLKAGTIFIIPGFHPMAGTWDMLNNGLLIRWIHDVGRGLGTRKLQISIIQMPYKTCTDHRSRNPRRTPRSFGDPLNQSSICWMTNTSTPQPRAECLEQSKVLALLEWIMPTL